MLRAIEYSFCVFESGSNNFLLIYRQTYKRTLDVSYATTDAMGIRVERNAGVVDYRK